MYTDKKTQSMGGTGRAAGLAGRGQQAVSKSSKDGSHIALEQHAVKAKHPHQKFVLPARNPKAGLVLISFGDQKLMVGRLKVKLGVSSNLQAKATDAV